MFGPPWAIACASPTPPVCSRDLKRLSRGTATGEIRRRQGHPRRHGPIHGASVHQSPNGMTIAIIRRHRGISIADVGSVRIYILALKWLFNPYVQPGVPLRARSPHEDLAAMADPDRRRHRPPIHVICRAAVSRNLSAQVSRRLSGGVTDASPVPAPHLYTGPCNPNCCSPREGFAMTWLLGKGQCQHS